MTSTNDGRDVKSNLTSGPKGKTYFIELYKTLEARLSETTEPSERTKHLCEAWRRVHSLCLHSASSTHLHLLSWLQRHTARTVLQTGWHLSKRKDDRKNLEDAINDLIAESREAQTTRVGDPPPWESQLVARGEWFKTILDKPWDHPVLTLLLNPNGTPPTDDEVLEWLKRERGVTLVVRLHSLVSDKCEDIACSLAAAIMDRVRADQPAAVINDEDKPTTPTYTGPFADKLREEAGFTVEVWDMLTDIEFVLEHKRDSQRCIALAKQTPLHGAYQLIERLHCRLETSPREKRLWKYAKDVAILIAQVVIARCMVIPSCTGAARSALYCCARSLADRAPGRLLRAGAALAAPAPTARHLHTLAAAVRAHLPPNNDQEMKPFVCELYVRAITAGMNELEKLKLKTDKECDRSGARAAAQTLAVWLLQLGGVVAGSRVAAECALTAFSLHPSPHMYDCLVCVPQQHRHNTQDPNEPKEETTKSDYGSWANDSRSMTNFVKTSETLNIKHTQNQANVLSTAILNESEGLGLSPELCQDIAVVLSGPRVKTFSWDMDREELLEKCRAYMEKTHGGTRALTTELKYLNLDPANFQHLPEDKDDDEDDIYYGIEKGYEHLVQFEEPEEIWQEPHEPDMTDSASSCSIPDQVTPRRKKKNKRNKIPSDDDSDPLSTVAEAKRNQKKQERPHSKGRGRPKKDTEKKKDEVDPLQTDDPTNEQPQKTKQKKERKKKEKTPKVKEEKSLSDLVGLKVKESKKKKKSEPVADSDFYKQYQLSLQLKAENNDGDNIVDVTSIDDKNGSSSDSMGLSNAELNSAYGRLANGAPSHLSKKLPNFTNKPWVPANYRPSSLTQNKKSSPSIKAFPDDIRASISRLLEFRRQKALEPNINKQPKMNAHMVQRKPTNAILHPPEIPMQTNISPKAVAIPEIPKSYIDKQQAEKLAALKKNVDMIISERKQIAETEAHAVHKPVIQFARKKKSKPPAAVSMNNESQHAHTSSIKMSDIVNVTNDRMMLEKMQRPNPCSATYATYDIVRPKRPVSNVSMAQERSASVAMSGQNDYLQFLKEYQTMRNNVFTDQVLDMSIKKSTKDIKNIKPVNRVEPLGLNTYKAEPKLPSAKPPIQQKKPDVSLNTFSRLSYMHKNKQQIEMKNKAVQEKPTFNLSTYQEVSTELDEIIRKHKNAQMKVIQARQDKNERVNDIPSSSCNSNVEDLKKYYQTQTANHPLLANLLEQNTITYASTSNARRNESQFKNTLTQHRPASSTKSSLTNSDQNDLLNLLRQQSKLNSSFYQTTRIYSPTPSDSVSDMSNDTSMSANKPASCPKQQQIVKNMTPVSIQASLETINIISNSIIKPADDVISKNFTGARSKSVISITKKNTKEQHDKVKKTETNKVKKEKKPAIITDAKKDNNWESVMNDILKHKTPSRGINALDVALNKSSFEKAFENSLKEPSVMYQQNPVNLSDANYNARKYPIKTNPSKSTNMPQILITANKEVKILKQVTLQTKTIDPKKSTNQLKSESTSNKKSTKVNSSEMSKKLPNEVQRKQFTYAGPKHDDPFISGIPNSDYDLLEELMDDDLRKEIGELSSDEETFNSAAQSFLKSPKSEKRVSVEFNVPPPNATANKPAGDIRCLNAHRYSGHSNVSDIHSISQRLVKKTDNKTIKENNIRKSQEMATNVRIQDNTPLNTKAAQSISSNVSTTPNYNVNVTNTPIDPNIYIAAVPHQPPIQNVVLIGSELVYEGYSTVQTPVNNVVSNIASNAYVAVNNAPNMTLYQSSSYVAPIVNAISVPIISAVPCAATISVQPNPINNVSESAPMINNVTESAPIVNNVIESAPIINIVSESTPMINNVTESAPILNNVTESAPIINIVSKSAPIVNNVTESAPMINIVSESAPILNNVTESTPIINIVSEPAPIINNVFESVPIINNVTESGPINIVPESAFRAATVDTQTNSFDTEKLDANILCNKEISNAVIHNDVKSVNDKVQDINIKINERKVLSEVQEKLAVTENTDKVKTQMTEYDKSLKIDVSDDKERLKKKRMAIINREIYHRCGNTPIALSYSPLPSLTVLEVVSDIVPISLSQPKTNDEEDLSNTEVSLLNTNTLSHLPDDIGDISSPVTPDNNENCKENKSNPKIPCRRILLRSSNKLKSKSEIDTALPAVNPSNKKTKVKLKSVTELVEKVDNISEQNKKDKEAAVPKRASKRLRNRTLNKNNDFEQEILKSREEIDHNVTCKNTNNKEITEKPIVNNIENGLNDIEAELSTKNVTEAIETADLPNTQHSIKQKEEIVIPSITKELLEHTTETKINDNPSEVSSDDVNIDNLPSISTNETAEVSMDTTQNIEIESSSPKINLNTEDSTPHGTEQNIIPQATIEKSKEENADAIVVDVSKNSNVDLDMTVTEEIDVAPKKSVIANIKYGKPKNICDKVQPKETLTTLNKEKEDKQNEKSTFNTSHLQVKDDKIMSGIVKVSNPLTTSVTNSESQSIECNQNNGNGSLKKESVSNTNPCDDDDIQIIDDEPSHHATTQKDIVKPVSNPLTTSVTNFGSQSIECNQNIRNGSLENEIVSNTNPCDDDDIQIIDDEPSHHVTTQKDTNVNNSMTQPIPMITSTTSTSTTNASTKQINDLSEISQSYKDSIIIEELPNLDAGDTSKKCVRVKLPNGRKFKATVYGEINVNFNTLFANPEIKSTLLQSVNSKKPYTINLKHVSSDPMRILSTNIQLVNLTKAPPLGHVETINLLSDDEDEPSSRELGTKTQVLETDYGNFKISNPIDKDILAQHQIKLRHMPIVPLVKIDATTGNKTQKLSSKDLSQNSIAEKLCNNIVVDKTPVLPTIPDMYISGLINDIEKKFTGLQDIPDVVEIDDSSNDSTNLKCYEKLEPESQINKLKDVLLHELGVIKNTSLISDDVIDLDAPNSRDDITIEDVSTEQVKTNSGTSICTTDVRSDNKKCKQNLIDKICRVTLIRCDDMINQKNEQTKTPKENVNNEGESYVSEPILESETADGAENISYDIINCERSILEDFSFLDTNVNEPEAERSSSPVIELFDVIASLDRLYQINSVMHESTSLSCEANWFTTKYMLHSRTVSVASLQVDDGLRYGEGDSNPQADNMGVETTQPLTRFVPKLISLVLKLLQDTDTIYQYQFIRNNTAEVHSLKRKSTTQENHLMSKISKLEDEIEESSNSLITSNILESSAETNVSISILEDVKPYDNLEGNDNILLDSSRSKTEDDNNVLIFTPKCDDNHNLNEHNNDQELTPDVGTVEANIHEDLEITTLSDNVSEKSFKITQSEITHLLVHNDLSSIDKTPIQSTKIDISNIQAFELEENNVDIKNVPIFLSESSESELSTKDFNFTEENSKPLENTETYKESGNINENVLKIVHENHQSPLLTKITEETGMEKLVIEGNVENEFDADVERQKQNMTEQSVQDTCNSLMHEKVDISQRSDVKYIEKNNGSDHSIDFISKASPEITEPKLSILKNVNKNAKQCLEDNDQYDELSTGKRKVLSLESKDSLEVFTNSLSKSDGNIKCPDVIQILQLSGLPKPDISIDTDVQYNETEDYKNNQKTCEFNVCEDMKIEVKESETIIKPLVENNEIENDPLVKSDLQFRMVDNVTGNCGHIEATLLKSDLTSHVNDINTETNELSGFKESNVNALEKTIYISSGTRDGSSTDTSVESTNAENINDHKEHGLLCNPLEAELSVKSKVREHCKNTKESNQIPGLEESNSLEESDLTSHVNDINTETNELSGFKEINVNAVEKTIYISSGSRDGSSTDTSVESTNAENINDDKEHGLLCNPLEAELSVKCKVREHCKNTKESNQIPGLEESNSLEENEIKNNLKDNLINVGIAKLKDIKPDVIILDSYVNNKETIATPIENNEIKQSQLDQKIPTCKMETENNQLLTNSIVDHEYTYISLTHEVGTTNKIEETLDFPLHHGIFLFDEEITENIAEEIVEMHSGDIIDDCALHIQMNSPPIDNKERTNINEQIPSENNDDKEMCMVDAVVLNKNIILTENDNSYINDKEPLPGTAIIEDDDTRALWNVSVKNINNEEETSFTSSDKSTESIISKYLAMLGDNESDLANSVTQIEYKDPEVGTCFVIPMIEKNADMNLEMKEKLQAMVTTIIHGLNDEVTNENETLDNEICQDLKFILPKRTYSKYSNKKEISRSKRRLNMSDIQFREKRIKYGKWRKGKNIDYPKSSKVEEMSYAKEYKKLFDYFNSIRFSYSIPFHKEYIDVHKTLEAWPIQGDNVNVAKDLDVESTEMLFVDTPEHEHVTFQPNELSLAKEIVTEYNENLYEPINIDESNFSKGFGDGSDRVKQEQRDGEYTTFSAATLSDVKQIQPLLPSEENQNYYSVEKFIDGVKCKKHKQTNMRTFYDHLNLKEKIRSFFENTNTELTTDWANKHKKDDFYGRNANWPFCLASPEYMRPAPVIIAVNVVQVGQLPVSAAAQNPVTCDPRVTHVSNVSPSQCFPQNNSEDDLQTSIKTEYTELTTADITLPLMQEYVQHHHSIPNESQDISNLHNSDENIPVATEIKSVVKIELMEETSQEQLEENIRYETHRLQLTESNLNNGAQYDYGNITNNMVQESESNVQTVTNSLEQPNITTISKQPSDLEKTDQIAHAMNAAGITASQDIVKTTDAEALVDIISQNAQSDVVTSHTTNTYSKSTPITTMALQQALAQILPQSLNQTNISENNLHSTTNPQVLHIVQSNNTPSVINKTNGTQLLHIVQNKNTINGTSTSQPNTFGGLSLVDGTIQQNGNLLHIVNAGQKNSNNPGQLLKRVNLLTNLTNVQGANEKMVHVLCKSSDGKSIQLPPQRSMVLRLQPLDPPNLQTTAKQNDVLDVGQSPSSTNPTNAANGNKDTSAQEIKSRSLYEENYAKFVQNGDPKPSQEKSTSLPKFNQVFGKQVYQDKQNEMDNNNLPENECPPEDNVPLEQMGDIGSPPMLIRKSQSQTTPAQPNLVQQIKQTIGPMNIPMHGGVIYTRQIPVNIGNGQTINLITVPSTEIVDDSNQKLQDGKFGNQDGDSPIIKIVTNNQTATTTNGTSEDNNNQMGSTNEAKPLQNPQPQPVLTQMRIKLPMLSKAPQMVGGTRVVRPSFFQIQRNVIGGANQQVYSQIVLTTAPQIGQTIRLPAQTQKPKTPSETQSSPESQMSSSTLEQLREFDMVLEQVKERSTVQPGSSTSSTSFPKLSTSADSTDAATPSTSTLKQDPPTQVLYSVGTTQPINIANFVNRKSTITSTTTSTFVRSPDSTNIAETPSSSTLVHLPHSVTATEPCASSSCASEAAATTSTPKPKKKSKPKSSSSSSNPFKINSTPPKTSTQKPLEDEQTTQRILYILAEYKEQVENSPDKDKPAPRRRNNPAAPTAGTSKRKKSSSGSRKRDSSPIGEDSCRTMGSEDSSCGTSLGECNECLESHSPEESPRKVVRKLTFEQETTQVTQTRTTTIPQRNVIVTDGQAFAVRGTTGKPATTVLMPANYLLPVSMVKGGQQIAIVTNRGPKLLVGAGEGGTGGTLLFQRLIGPAGLKPVLTRPGVRHIRLPTAALHNLQTFNIAAAAPTVQPPDSTASSAPTPAPPDLVDTRAMSSPWPDRSSDGGEPKPDKGNSSPEGSEPWNLPSSSIADDYGYEEIVRTDNMDRTVLDAIPDRYSPDMEAQRIFDKMFDVDSKKSMYDSRCSYDIDASDDDKAYHQVVQRKDGRHHRLTHVSAAALRHKYAILEHELRLQKSLSEECEDLGVDSPSASELFPEAELLFAPSPAHEQTIDHCHTPQPSLLTHGIPQPDLDDQIASDRLLTPRHDNDLDINLDDVGEIVTVGEDGMTTIQLDHEEFARSHPNTTFHSEPEDGEIPPFTIAQGLKGRPITFGRGVPTVLMAPQTTVISQATVEAAGTHNTVKFTDIDNIINALPGPQQNIMVKDDLHNLMNEREMPPSAIVHSTGNGTQVIRRAETARYDEDALRRDHSKERTADDSPERQSDVFWDRQERRFDFDKCCKGYEESDVAENHTRLDSVIKAARSERRRSDSPSNEAPPLRTYTRKPTTLPSNSGHNTHTEERTHRGHAEEISPLPVRCHEEGRRRASNRGVVKRGCHCCNGSAAPPKPKKSKKRPDFHPH